MNQQILRIVLLFFLGINGASAAFTEKLSGVWEGTGKQNSGLEWSIRFKSDGSQFLIEYPSLSCSGTWELLSETQTSATFFQHIEIGKDRCVDDTVKVSQIDFNKLLLEYSWGNGAYNAHGELWRVSDVTIIPPAEIGTIYTVVKYKSGSLGLPATTSLSVVWGTFKKSGTVAPPELSGLGCSVPLGFVLKLDHTKADSVPLTVSTSGTIKTGSPFQGAAPAEWNDICYKQVSW